MTTMTTRYVLAHPVRAVIIIIVLSQRRKFLFKWFPSWPVLPKRLIRRTAYVLLLLLFGVVVTRLTICLYRLQTIATEEGTRRIIIIRVYYYYYYCVCIGVYKCAYKSTILLGTRCAVTYSSYCVCSYLPFFFYIPKKGFTRRACRYRNYR